MINCNFSVALWGNVLGGIAGITLLILSCCCSNFASLSLERLHNRQMTQNNNMPPAREPAPMAIPITTRGANVVASNFFLVILAADVVVIVVLLIGVDIVLLVSVDVVLPIGEAVVLLVGVPVVMLFVDVAVVGLVVVIGVDGA